MATLYEVYWSAPWPFDLLFSATVLTAVSYYAFAQAFEDERTARILGVSTGLALAFSITVWSTYNNHPLIGSFWPAALAMAATTILIVVFRLGRKALESTIQETSSRMSSSASPIEFVQEFKNAIQNVSEQIRRTNLEQKSERNRLADSLVKLADQIEQESKRTQATLAQLSQQLQEFKKARDIPKVKLKQKEIANQGIYEWALKGIFDSLRSAVVALEAEPPDKKILSASLITCFKFIEKAREVVIETQKVRRKNGYVETMA